MKKPRILVVGSFILDQIVTTSKMPKSGETIIGRSFSKAPGGKGANQAVQAARLGCEVTMVGKLGRDQNGEELLRSCNAAGVSTEHVLFDETVASGCSVIVLEEKEKDVQNRIIIVPGTNMLIKPEEVACLKAIIQKYDMLLLQLEIPMEVNTYVADIAYQAGVPIMLNPAPSAPLSDELLAKLSFISPNEHEMEDLTGIHIRRDGEQVNIGDVRAAAMTLLERGVKNVIVTLGSAGAVFVSKDSFFHSKCAPNVQVKDPTAAGDSFIAAFCAAYACNVPIKECLQFANYTAGITVSKMGAMPSMPSMQMVEGFYQMNGEAVPDLLRKHK